MASRWTLSLAMAPLYSPATTAMSLVQAEVACRAAEHAAKGCDAIYLTIDIDFIDTGFFPATGSVVNDAITPAQMIEILEVLEGVPHRRSGLSGGLAPYRPLGPLHEHFHGDSADDLHA